jgi:dihydropteroate synthase
VGTIARDLEAAISRVRHAGVDRTRLVVDPGLGFGKRKEQNSFIISHLGKLAGLDLPVMAGPSRKSFLARPDPTATKFATAAAVTASIMGGAHIIRVHDVAEMRTVADMADEFLRAQSD